MIVAVLFSIFCAYVAYAQESKGREFGVPLIKKPLLIHSGIFARPWYFLGNNHVEYIDSLPFSGFAYNIPATWTVMNSTEYGPWTETDIRDQLGGLDFTFSNLNRNWVSVVVRRNGTASNAAEGDFFDDAAWATTVEQFRLLARVASDPKYQCVGIAFDNEEYFEGVFNYPDDVAFPAKYNVQQYRAKARQRGREVMSAVLEEWPDARVLFLHGPYRSTPEERPWEVSANQIGNADEYELDAHFFFGTVEVSGNRQVYDGGETYQLRDENQFEINRNWRRFELRNSSIVPFDLKRTYTRRVGITHGLYNEPWPTPDDEMDPQIMRTTLENALRSGDAYNWIFIEATTRWLEPGGMPQQWQTEIQDAINAANRRPGG